ncbi:hypothetical protein [Aureispira sp. CCB-E]|uniref:hypothetical protein n=1 Tax=Aureispira sp. CCB-E TaxID=3051121 RepID=UPI00286924AC|nr:hypothetical protein [Aureispira sp. CCB-E]WMX15635.1 hypothetical protein QP953_04480 [Aureispira sp. CCB-E]
MKTITLSMLLFMSLSILAQDNIIQRDGSEIKAKVLEITPKIIQYKRFDNINGPTYSILKANVFMIQYENGTKDVFQDTTVTTIAIPPTTNLIDTLRTEIDSSIIRNYIFVNGAISVGFNQTTPNSHGHVTYTSIGHTGGLFYEMGNVVFFAPKKMPKNLGIGLNFTWLSIGVTYGYPYLYLFPYTGGFGPHFSFKLNPKSHLDIYVKPSVSILPIEQSFKAAFLMDVGVSFRYKAFTVGISGAIIPTLYGDYYVSGNKAPSYNIPHRYSHIKLRIGASIQNKY